MSGTGPNTGASVSATTVTRQAADGIHVTTGSVASIANGAYLVRNGGAGLLLDGTVATMSASSSTENTIAGIRLINGASAEIGASNIDHNLADGVTVDELVNRLKARQTETPEGLNLRIATARKELQRIKDFDYVVINRDSHLDEAIDTILDIIHAEHHRVQQRKVTL